MPRRLMLAAVLVTTLAVDLSSARSHAQSPEEPSPASIPLVETPAPPLIPQPDEHLLSPSPLQEQDDAVMVLGELRSAVRSSPKSAEDRLNLAQGLYRLGDVDAAIDECRMAIRLDPGDANAHLQLGVLFIMKQEWRAALSVLKEAVRLNPQLTHAHYSLGNVQYALGAVNAAIQSYRQTLELQPHFPDGRYRLALLLKLTNQPREAAQLMEEAAIGGIPQAQFFLGNAYRSGQGIEKNPALAIFWWTKAAEFGHQPAAEALSKFRRQALASDQPDQARKDKLEAFRAYRDRLWNEFPDFNRTSDGQTLGTTLLKQRRLDSALPVLLLEAYALSEAALGELASLYETGWNDTLAPFDTRILTCLETLAAEGFVPAQKTVARIYGKGLGTEPDLQKAKTVLKGLPKREAKLLLDELGNP